MHYIAKYHTPLRFSDLILESDGEALTGLRFLSGEQEPEGAVKDLPVFRETAKWLDLYFSGKDPDFVPKYKIEGATPFRQEVSAIMKRIPYGQTVTYGDIAAEIARSRGVAKMSAQAVGGAVGWNPVGIIIPCHRVMGANGSLTGYGGGLENKIELLKLEGIHLK